MINHVKDLLVEADDNIKMSEFHKKRAEQCIGLATMKSKEEEKKSNRTLLVGIIVVLILAALALSGKVNLNFTDDQVKAAQTNQADGQNSLRSNLVIQNQVQKPEWGNEEVDVMSLELGVLNYTLNEKDFQVFTVNPNLARRALLVYEDELAESRLRVRCHEVEDFRSEHYSGSGSGLSVGYFFPQDIIETPEIAIEYELADGGIAWILFVPPGTGQVKGVVQAKKYRLGSSPVCR